MLLYREQPIASYEVELAQRIVDIATHYAKISTLMTQPDKAPLALLKPCVALACVPEEEVATFAKAMDIFAQDDPVVANAFSEWLNSITQAGADAATQVVRMAIAEVEKHMAEMQTCEEKFDVEAATLKECEQLKSSRVSVRMALEALQKTVVGVGSKESDYPEIEYASVKADGALEKICLWGVHSLLGSAQVMDPINGKKARENLRNIWVGQVQSKFVEKVEQDLVDKVLKVLAIDKPAKDNADNAKDKAAKEKDKAKRSADVAADPPAAGKSKRQKVECNEIRPTCDSEACYIMHVCTHVP